MAESLAAQITVFADWVIPASHAAGTLLKVPSPTGMSLKALLFPASYDAGILQFFFSEDGATYHRGFALNGSQIIQFEGATDEWAALNRGDFADFAQWDHLGIQHSSVPASIRTLRAMFMPLDFI